MIPEEKAKDLFVKNIELIPDYIKQIDAKHIAKYCAIIAVGEILLIANDYFFHDEDEIKTKAYWQEVKQEIEKL
jgi:hypothetical protein